MIQLRPLLLPVHSTEQYLSCLYSRAVSPRRDEPRTLYDSEDSRFRPEIVVADDGQSAFTVDCHAPQVFLSALDQEERVLSQAQKFRKGLQAGQIIASLASEGGMVRFRNRYQLLQDLINYWKLGIEVVLTPLKNSKALEQAIPEVPESVVNSEIAVEDYHEITDQAVLESLARGPGKRK